MKLFEVKCSDRSGEHVYEGRLIHEFGNFSPELRSPGAVKKKAVDLYIESSQYDVLFSDYTKGDMSAFVAVFLDPKGVWVEIIRQTDQRIVGCLYLTNVIRRFDALAHFTFWDSIAKGREPIIRAGLKLCFERYSLERISSEIPVYQSGVLRFVRRIGFTEEGRKRKGTLHKGSWIDTVLFGFLREEFEDGSQLWGELRERDSDGVSEGSGSPGLELVGVHDGTEGSEASLGPDSNGSGSEGV